MACDTSILIEQAKCYDCNMSGLMFSAVEIVLLCAIRDGTLLACDSQTLITQASCILGCIPPNMMPAVKIAILCQILNASGAGVFTAELLSGLVHYWKLEEASGSSRIDSIGSTNLAEIISNGVKTTVGKRGNGVNGSLSTSVLFGASGVSLSPLTIACWINPLILPASNKSFCEGFGVSTDPVIALAPSGQIVVLDHALATILTLPSAPLLTWSLVVLTINGAGTTWKGSVNNSIFISNSAAAPSGTAFIVLDGSATPGYIDEIGIWNRELSQSEVSSLWNGGTGRFLS